MHRTSHFWSCGPMAPRSTAIITRLGLLHCWLNHDCLYNLYSFTSFLNVYIMYGNTTFRELIHISFDHKSSTYIVIGTFFSHFLRRTKRTIAEYIISRHASVHQKPRQRCKVRRQWRSADPPLVLIPGRYYLFRREGRGAERQLFGASALLSNPLFVSSRWSYWQY